MIGPARRPASTGRRPCRFASTATRCPVKRPKGGSIQGASGGALTFSGRMTSSPRCAPDGKKRCASVPAVNGPKTLQNPQGFSRFGRPTSAPIVHRKHAGTVPLPHRRRAASATRAGSARRDDARERNQRADIPVSNSRRHGPPIANQAPHRHRQAKSGTCRGREPPHARHTFEVLPPETTPHKIDLSGYVPPSWHLCRTHPHGESQLT